MKIGHKKDENHCRGVSTHPLFPRFFLLLEEKVRGKLMTGGALASDLFPYSLASYLTCTGGVGIW